MNSGPLPPEAFCQLLPAAQALGAWAPLTAAAVLALAQFYGGKTQPRPLIPPGPRLTV